MQAAQHTFRPRLPEPEMPPSPHPVRSIVPALACLMALAGCGEPDTATRDGATTAEAPLPGPQPAGGAVTDMPAAPGPGEVPLAGTSPTPAHDPTALQGTPLPPLEENPEAGLVPLVAVDPAASPPTASAIVPGPLSATAPAPDPAAASTTASEDPRDLLRGYYAAINTRDFAAAHAAWADGTSAPGRTPEQFAAAFADAASIELTLGAPRPADGGAGTAHVEVPVTVTTTRTDGSVQHQAGRYTLRRSQMDGARAWRIDAVDLRDAAR